MVLVTALRRKLMVSKQPFARRILLAFVLMTVMVSGIFSIGIVALVHFVDSPELPQADTPHEQNLKKPNVKKSRKKVRESRKKE